MKHPQDQYYFALNQYIAFLLDLSKARTELACLRFTPGTTSARQQDLQKRITRLNRMAIASQRVLALKEEALEKAVNQINFNP